MKLAIVIPGFQSGPTDWCIPAFTNLARELSARHEVHVFALRYPAQGRTYAIGKVTVHAIGGGGFGPVRIPVLSLVKLWSDALRAIRAEHNSSAFDAIMGIWATESGWLATRAGRLLHRPVLLHLAGGELVWLPDIGYGNTRRGLSGALVNASLRHADLLTAPSDPVMKLARKRGVPADRLETWPLGVDTDMFAPTVQTTEQDAGDPFVFATAGSLIPVKDHTWLIEAFCLLRRLAPARNFRLRIAGSGPLQADLAALVRAAELGGYVEFAGEVGHSSLPGFFRSAHCCVLTSRYEAQCMAILEAMACGLPWIGPQVGALADLARHDHNRPSTGLPVSDRSPQSLALAMLSMAEMPEQARAEMGYEARRVVVERYSLPTQTCKLDAFLQRLTSHGPVARMS